MKPDEATLELLGRLDGTGYEWRKYGVEWRKPTTSPEPPLGDYKFVTFYPSKYVKLKDFEFLMAVISFSDEIVENEEIYHAFMEGAGPDSVVHGECVRHYVTLLMRKNASQAARSASRVTDIPLLVVERDDEHFLFEVWHRGDRAAVCRFEGERRVEWEGFERLPEIAPPLDCHGLIGVKEYEEDCRSEDRMFWSTKFLWYFYSEPMAYRGDREGPSQLIFDRLIETAWKGVDMYCPTPQPLPPVSEEEIAADLAALDDLPTTTLKPIQTFDGWLSDDPALWTNCRSTEYYWYGYIGDLQCYPVNLYEKDEDGTSAFPYFFDDDGSLALLTADRWHHAEQLDRLGVDMKKVISQGHLIGRRYGGKINVRMPDARGHLYGFYKGKVLIEFGADLKPIHRYKVKGKCAGWYLNARGELCFIARSYTLVPKDQGDVKKQENIREKSEKMDFSELIDSIRTAQDDEEKKALMAILDSYFIKERKDNKEKRWKAMVYRVEHGGGGV